MTLTILAIAALLQAAVSCIHGIASIRQTRRINALQDRVRYLEQRCDDCGIYANQVRGPEPSGPRGVLQ